MGLSRILLSCVFWALAAPALAQIVPAAGAAPAEDPFFGTCTRSTQWQFEQVSANHLRLTGQVQVECPEMAFFADVVDMYTDPQLRIVASGNVVFTNPEGRIAAERVEFNMADGTGTFHMASGIMSLGEEVDRAQFGNQEPEVYFYGDTIEKLDQRKYRLTRGGFTTCVQPTPRWEVTSQSVVITLDDYAFARNTLLRVKGVPLLYLPVLYYPIKEDDRATGFLLPTYGVVDAARPDAQQRVLLGDRTAVTMRRSSTTGSRGSVKAPAPSTDTWPARDPTATSAFYRLDQHQAEFTAERTGDAFAVAVFVSVHRRRQPDVGHLGTRAPAHRLHAPAS